MKVRDVMTREVVTIAPSATLGEAAAPMARHRISGLPVIDGERLVGIIAEGDLVRYLKRVAPYYLYLFVETGAFIPPEPDLATRLAEVRQRPVAEAMTRRVVTVRPDQDLDEVAALLAGRHIKRAPVMDGDRLVGIVSRLDLVRVLAAEATAPPSAPA